MGTSADDMVGHCGLSAVMLTGGTDPTFVSRERGTCVYLYRDLHLGQKRTRRCDWGLRMFGCELDKFDTVDELHVGGIRLAYLLA